MPFLFKLKRPHNHIGGGGFFVASSTLPLSLAWEVFGEKNGAASLEELKALIEPLKKDKSSEPEIGCTVLTNPFFMQKQSWLENPPGWAGSIVRGKMYETAKPDGMFIWDKMSKYSFFGLGNFIFKTIVRSILPLKLRYFIRREEIKFLSLMFFAINSFSILSVSVISTAVAASRIALLKSLLFL